MRTRIWKLTALVMALLLALTGCSLIEIDQEMDNAEAVATVNSATITKGEVKNTYEYYQNYYAYMNYYYTGSSDISSQLESIKDTVLELFIRNELVKQKAAELGLDTLTDDDKATIEEKAAGELEDYIADELEDGHIDTEGLSEEEIRAAALAHLEENGVTLDALIESDTASFIADRVRENVISGISVDDSEIQEAFDKEVADDESSFSSSTYLYELYRSNGTAIYWNPEGYRTVKHILLKMSDDQKSELTALDDELDGVQDMIDALENPSEEADADAAEEATEEAEPALTLDELIARKAELEKKIEDKKAEIIASFSDKTDEIYKKLEEGASFDDLMAEYGEDPGMQSEPSMTEGYYVAEGSTIWEDIFTETAMALAKKGDVSEPVLGSNGVHIIYYNDDVTPGAIDIATVRDDLAASLLSTKQDDAYEAEYQKWYSAAKIKKYPSRMNY
ncbi:MAG: SurA N-terminal domain-containing protein [Clostridia bacterium]|nr:SurA N-terminal domain-containing protein [Clostridia bacterium]